MLVSHDREFLARSVTRVVERTSPSTPALSTAVVTGAWRNGGGPSPQTRGSTRVRRAQDRPGRPGPYPTRMGRARVSGAIRKRPTTTRSAARGPPSPARNRPRKVRPDGEPGSRAEEVVEPRKEWFLEFSIGSRPIRAPSSPPSPTPSCNTATSLSVGVSGQRRRPDQNHWLGTVPAETTFLLRLLLGQESNPLRECHARLECCDRRDRSGRGQFAGASLHSRWLTVSRSWSPMSTADVRTLAKFGLRADTSASRPPPCHPGEDAVGSCSCGREGQRARPGRGRPPPRPAIEQLEFCTPTATTARCRW